MTVLAKGRARSALYELGSLLLRYPDDTLIARAHDFSTAVAELPRSRSAQAIARFYGWWRSEPPIALQQHYVQTFDLQKRCGLYLTFYGEGDRRQRGMALLRLKRMYRAAGLPLDGGELPDFLPVMLEFAACAPRGRGELVLREHRPAIELLRHSLAERASPYADLLAAVCHALGELSARDRARMLRLAAAGPPRELVGLEPFAPPEVMPHAEARR